MPRKPFYETMSPDHGGDIWNRGKIPIDFSANINPLGPSKKALNELHGWKVGVYPPADNQRLRTEIARHLGTGPDNITIGNGSMELIKEFCSLTLSPSDNTVIIEPTFSEYARFSCVYGKGSHPVLPQKGFEPTADEIKESVDSDTRIIFICRPNNPTGTAMRQNELDEILQFAAGKDIFVFLDEAFIEFSDLKSYSTRVNEFRNLFVLRSFTKFYALPGVRIGYGIGNPELISRLEAARPPWNINIFAHDMALASLGDTDYVKQTRTLVEREKKYLVRELKKAGITVYPSKANFLLLKYNWNSRDVKKDLLNKGLLIRDCSSFHGLDTRFIRLCIRERSDNMLLVRALKKHAEMGVKKGRECPYYPCHFEGQDCHFCFCLFYPCGDESRGRMVIGKKGLEVWSCKECNAIHIPETARRVRSALEKEDADKLDIDKLLGPPPAKKSIIQGRS